MHICMYDVLLLVVVTKLSEASRYIYIRVIRLIVCVWNATAIHSSYLMGVH